MQSVLTREAEMCDLTEPCRRRILGIHMDYWRRQFYNKVLQWILPEEKKRECTDNVEEIT